MFLPFFDDKKSFLHHLSMKKLLVLLSLVVLISCEGSGGSAKSEDSVSPQMNESVTNEFMALVNSHRKSLGLKNLIHSDAMALIAAHHSKDMADKSVSFGHDGFSSRCAEARTALGSGNFCGENVAMGQKTAQAVFTAWMNSPSHRANIENSRVTHSGLGLATDKSGAIYWTHLFLEK